MKKYRVLEKQVIQQCNLEGFPTEVRLKVTKMMSGGEVREDSRIHRKHQESVSPLGKIYWLSKNSLKETVYLLWYL